MMDNIGAIHTSVEKYRMSQVHNTDGARAIQGCHPRMVFEKVALEGGFTALAPSRSIRENATTQYSRLNGPRTALRSNQTDRDMKHTTHSAYQGHGDGNTLSGDIWNHWKSETSESWRPATSDLRHYVFLTNRAVEANFNENAVCV